MIQDTHGNLNEKDFVDALLAAVVALIGDLASRGVTAIPTTTYEAHWMEPVLGDDGRLEGKRQTFTELTPGDILWVHDERLMELPTVARLGTMLADFASRYGGFPASSWSGGPAELSRRVVHQYLTRSSGLVADETIARTVIHDYCTDVSVPSIAVRSIYQIEDFSALRPFDLSEEIRFRPIEKKDIRDQAQRSSSPYTHEYPRPWLDVRNWVCEINRKGPRDTYDAANWRNEGVRHIAATVGLVSPGTARFYLLSSSHASPFFSTGNTWGGSQILTGPGGKHVHLGEDAIDLARAYYPRVVSALNGTDCKHHRLPLSRFMSAAQRNAQGDQLVDYVIGLESLLAPDTDRLEATIRFRLRGAALLPGHFGAPTERIDLMNKVYDARSRVVHGDIDGKDLSQNVPRAEDALRHVLRWFLDDARRLQHPKKVMRELDEMMVQGGSEWAHPA